MNKEFLFPYAQISTNDFEIIKLIKEGGFSSVYSVRHKKSKKIYAAKVIHRIFPPIEYIQKTISEIFYMISIQHLTIAKFYGYSSTDFQGEDNVTIFMKLYKNGSLSDYIKKCRQSLADLEFDYTKRLKILIGISYGLAILHANGFCHCDIKPDNILLDKKFRACICDFGLSKYKKDNINNEKFGTPPYMAPETIKNAVYDNKSDVYSFGILM